MRLLAIVGLIASISALADDDDALFQTQQVLTDSAKRGAAIQGDAQAKAADAQLKQVAGDQSERVYQLSSQIFEQMAKGTNGDPEALQKIVEAAGRNPAAFANGLSDAQRAELKSVSEAIEKRNKALDSY